jgi:protein-tyrosine phosphatase
MRELIRWCRGVSLQLRLIVRPGGNDAPSPMPPVSLQRGRRRILVVCSSNASRSPFVAQTLQRRLGDDSWQVVSAGVDAVEGEPVSDQTSVFAARHGADLSFHRSRRITRELIDTSDLVIAMSHEQVEAILELEPGAGRRIRLLGGFHTFADPWLADGRKAPLADASGAAQRTEDAACDEDCYRELIAGVENLSRFIVRREASRRAPHDRSPLSTPPLQTVRAR